MCPFSLNLSRVSTCVLPHKPLVKTLTATTSYRCVRSSLVCHPNEEALGQSFQLGTKIG